MITLLVPVWIVLVILVYNGDAFSKPSNYYHSVAFNLIFVAVNKTRIQAQTLHHKNKNNDNGFFLQAIFT